MGYGFGGGFPTGRRADPGCDLVAFTAVIFLDGEPSDSAAADQIVGEDLGAIIGDDKVSCGGAEGVDLPECVRYEDQEIVEV